MYVKHRLKRVAASSTYLISSVSDHCLASSSFCTFGSVFEQTFKGQRVPGIIPFYLSHLDKTESLNSGNQCNRDLKTARKGRHD